jgi:hypothetical protein
MTVPIRPPRSSRLLELKILGGGGFPPLAVAALVRTDDDPPEDMVLLSLEVPLACALPPSITKERLEQLCMERLIADLSLQDPQESWAVLGRGADPPDFRVQIGTQDVGVELTAFTSQARRRGHAEFRRVRADLLAAGPLGFQHLRGNLVYFWADTDERPDSVVQSRDRSGILEGLRSFRPIVNPIGDDPGKPFPQVLPDLGTGNARPWQYLAVPWEGWHSALSALLGFDIGVCIQSSHSFRDAHEEVARLIASHDTAGCDILVVQVGAPDRYSLTYPTDEVIIDLAIDEMRRTGVHAAHVQRVLVHYWRRGEVVEVLTRVGS